MSIPRTWLVRYGVAILAVFVTFGVKLLFDSFFQEGSSFLLFSLAVLVGAVFGGFGPGVAATLIAALVGDYFFVEPVRTLVPPTLDHGLRTGLFAAQGFAISGIGAALMSAGERSERALEETRKAEENYRGIFENAVDGIFRTASDGRIVAANPAMAQMLGYDSPDEVIAGWATAEHFYADHSEREKFLYLMSENGVVRDFEVRLRHKDGGEVWTSVSARSVRDGGENAIEGIIEDITERKRVEDELRLRDRAISESANGIVITDATRPDNPIVYVNPAFESITGYTAKEVLGGNCRFLQGVDRYQPPLEDLRKAIEREEPSTMILRNYKKDGTPFWNELSVSPVRDAEGEVTHFVGVQVDVTRRRRAEESLRRSEERLRQATDAAALGTWDYNPVSGELLWDERCREIFGLPPDAGAEVGADHELLLSRLHPDDRERMDEAVSRALDPESGGEYRMEYRVISGESGPSRWVDSRGQAFFEEDGQPARLVGTMQDITARKRDEEERRILAEAGSELASSLDYESTLAGVARLVVPDFADWCAVDMLSEDGEVQRLAVAHQDPEMVRWAHELQRRYPTDLDAPTGLPRVLRSGEAEFYPEITDEMLAATIEDEERLEIVRRLGFTSVMVVPLIARGRTLGAITFVTTESGRRYESRDLELASELARRAAVAVDNARLYGEARKELAERRRTEEALRASDDRYRTFVEQATEGIWRFEIGEPLPVGIPADEQLEIFYRHAYLAECNDAMARMYGYARAEEIEGVRLEDLLPRSIPENVEYLRSFIRSGYRLNDTESREPDRHGNIRFFLNNLTGVVENGILERAWGTQRDITERKRIEQALRESEEQYRVVAETASDGIVLIDDDSRVLFANSALGRIFGYAVEELVGQSLTTLMPEYLRHIHEASLGRYLDTGERHLNWDSIQLPGWHRDGYEIPLEVSFGEFAKEGRRFFSGFIRDITERKRAEEARTRLAAIVESSEDAIIGKTLEGVITSWNRGAQKLYGYSAEEVVGKHISILTPPELSGEIPRILESIGRGESVEKETVRVSKDGRRLNISLSVSPIEDLRGNLTGASTIARDITERKRAEENLRQIEKRFRATFEQAAVGVAHVGLDGSWLRVNERLCDIVGYSGEELLEKTFQDITHPDDLETDLEHLHRLLTGEIQRYSVEKRYFRGDGSTVWVNLTVSLVRDAEGEPDYLVSVIEDISGRKRIEHNLKESEERYRTLFESIDEGFCVIESLFDEDDRPMDYRFIEINPAFEKQTGLENAVGRTMLDLVPDIERRWIEIYGNVALTGEPVRFEDHAEAMGRWFDVYAYRIRGLESRRVAVLFKDITERKRTEEALRQSEELYRSVVEQAAEGIYLADARTLRILEANAALAETLGYTEEELEQMTIYDISPHDRESVDENARLALENGRHYIGERKYRHKDGSLVDVEISLSTIPHEGHEALCVVAHDVSELRKAEKTLREVKEAEQVRIAQDLHDTVLQDMAYAVQEMNVRQIIAESQGEKDPQLEEISEALRRGIESLRAAVFEMRLQGETDKSFVGSLESLVDLQRRMARNRYTIGMTVGHDFPEQLSETARIEATRIIQEALSNVRKHSGASQVHVSLGVEGDDLWVEVSDDGRGFDEASSVGLGTTSMNRRAKMLGGELEIASQPGEGTRVRFRAPRERWVQEDRRA